MKPRKFDNDANYFGGKRKPPKAKSKFTSVPMPRQGTVKKKVPMPPLPKQAAPTHGMGVAGRL